ncbi:MAG: hypothetical protein K8R76_08310 [Candidatus Aegiribacteria sp.]|nr:hypothetical protein [Candidatus Aegiribacteria sp.]
MNTILLTIVLALTPSNMELAEEALVISSEALSDILESYNVQNIIIEILGEHEGGWFLEQTLASVLCENDISIISSVSDSSFRSFDRLMVRPMEIVVEYGDVSRPWLIGSKRVERIARCELSATLVDSNGKIVTTARTNGTADDVVSWSDVSTLSGSSEWEWLSRELPEDSGSSILEPLIVSGVVASLVYLFYSSRAD